MTAPARPAAQAHAETPAVDAGDDAVNIPPHSYWSLFLRFLRFGFLAWGGLALSAAGLA